MATDLAPRTSRMRGVAVRATVSVALGCVSSAPWVVWEIRRLTSTVSFGQAARIAFGAVVVAVALALPAVVVLAAMWESSLASRLRGSYRERPVETAGAALVVTVSASIACAMVFLISTRTRTSSDVTGLMLAVVVAAYVCLILVVERPLRALLVRGIGAMPDRMRAPAVTLALSLLLAVGACIGLGVGASSVVYALELDRLWMVCVMWAVMALATLLRPRRRGLVFAAAGVAATLTMLSGVLLALGVEPRTVDALRRRAPVTSMLRGVVATRVQSSAGHRNRWSCVPGEPLPTPGTIGSPDRNVDIILFTVDALRFDATNLVKRKRKTMPELARHASGAAVFSAYTPATSTRQSFRALFTGLYPSLTDPPKARRWATAIPKGFPTLARYLQKANYRTVTVQPRKVFFSRESGALAGFDEVDLSRTKYHRKQRHSADALVDGIVSHLSDPERDKRPMFIWAHALEPHQPYLTGPRPKFGKRGRQGYDSAVRFVDGELDRLLRFARSPSRRGKTVIIVTSDHGQAFGEHSNRNHGATTYEEEVRVPLLFWGPGVRARRNKTAVSTLDLVPTILDYLGLDVPEAYCGRSLWPSLQAGKEPEETPIYVEQLADASQKHFAIAYVEDGVKLVHFPKTGTSEVYNLRKDPKEQQDLAQSDPELLKKMTEALRARYRTVGMDPQYYKL